MASNSTLKVLFILPKKICQGISPIFNHEENTVNDASVIAVFNAKDRLNSVGLK